jgi:hypothetical protein
MSLSFDQQSMWNRLNGDPGNWYEQNAEPERKEFREFMLGLLLSEKVLVEFTKSDGSVRVMNCTLSESYGAKYSQTVNPVPVEKAHKPPKVNNDVCKIWDIDQGAWRSFRWDRLKKIQFVLESKN